jgi:hypothetical protein
MKGQIMTNEEILQKTLSATLERLGKQATAYEVEIANLNAQIVLLNSQVASLSKKSKDKVVETNLIEKENK